MKKIFALLLSTIMIMSFSGLAFAGESVEDLQLPETSENGEMVLEDYSTIEISNDDIAVSDETIDSYIETMVCDITGAAEDEEVDTSIVTDEFITEYSLVYFGTQLNTVEEARNYIHDTLQASAKTAAVFNALKEKAEVSSYPADWWDMVYAYAQDEISFYASMNGVDEDTQAVSDGYDSAAEYAVIDAESYLDSAMIVEQILSDKGIAVTDEEVDAALADYMSALGYDAYYSVDEFKEMSGETWMWLFTELQYKAGLAYDAVADNVVVK